MGIAQAVGYPVFALAILYVFLVIYLLFEAYNSNVVITKEDLLLDDMEDVAIEKLTDEISFRLLATRKHPDYKWLKDKLKKIDNGTYR
tara:strand:- start:1735 stop:1998 length:264 start_codon:yes stop_codon:yes gene_type:complete